MTDIAAPDTPRRIQWFQNFDGALLLSSRARDILRIVFSRFADQIDRVSVFGSRALGGAHPASDIDLAVYGGLNDAMIAPVRTLLDESSLAVTADMVRYDGLGTLSRRRHIDQCAVTSFDQNELFAIRDAAGSRAA